METPIKYAPRREGENEKQDFTQARFAFQRSRSNDPGNSNFIIERKQLLEMICNRTAVSLQYHQDCSRNFPAKGDE